MNDLKNSVALLFFFLLLIFGVAQVNYIEENVLNFSPLFFVLVTLAVVTGLLFKPSTRLTIYTFIMAWGVVYVLGWVFYWRVYAREPMQVLIIQFLLVEISAGLAFDVGRQMAQVSSLLRGLTASTYPNRTIELAQAEGRISAELTRSRRYHHPLSLLVVHVDRFAQGQLEQHVALQRDILAQFASAKVGQIISERARETDLIMRDQQGRFILLCPETSHESSNTLARRIQEAVAVSLGAEISTGSSFFPTEALTFDDLIQKAEERLEDSYQTRRHVPASEEALVEDSAGVGEKRVS
jgi:GGDEF domain-containing protein